MERVEPIRSEKKIKDLKNYLIGSGNVRNYVLIVLGLNTALRVSDMLSLTWSDVYDFEEKELKSHVYITEQKTSKRKKFLLNNSALECLKRLKKELGRIIPLDYLFVSRQGDNKPITRFMANKIVKASCDAVGSKSI